MQLVMQKEVERL